MPDRLANDRSEDLWPVAYSTETPPPRVEIDWPEEQTHCELDHDGGVCGRRLSAIKQRCPVHGDGVTT